VVAFADAGVDILRKKKKKEEKRENCSRRRKNQKGRGSGPSTCIAPCLPTCCVEEKNEAGHSSTISEGEKKGDTQGGLATSFFEASWNKKNRKGPPLSSQVGAGKKKRPAYLVRAEKKKKKVGYYKRGRHSERKKDTAGAFSRARTTLGGKRPWLMGGKKKKKREGGYRQGNVASPSQGS